MLPDPTSPWGTCGRSAAPVCHGQTPGVYKWHVTRNTREISPGGGLQSKSQSFFRGHSADGGGLSVGDQSHTTSAEITKLRPIGPFPLDPKFLHYSVKRKLFQPLDHSSNAKRCFEKVCRNKKKKGPLLARGLLARCWAGPSPPPSGGWGGSVLL